MMRWAGVAGRKDEFWLYFDEATDLPFSARLITDRKLVRVNGVKYEILTREWNLKGGVTLRVRLTDQSSVEVHFEVSYAVAEAPKPQALDMGSVKKPRTRPNILKRTRDMDI